MGSTAINFTELWGKLAAGGGHSALRDERKASYQKKEYIPMLKRESGMVSRLCLVMDVEMFFNPATGEPDEMYNEMCPFRPALAVSTVVEMVKGYMKADPELKAKYMQMAGVEEYEIEDVKCIPAIDYPIFKKYLKFRQFTLPVVTISDSAITHSQYPQKYLFDVPKDPETDEYEGDHVVLKIAKWFTAVNFAKKNHLDACWEKAKKGEPFDLAPLSFSTNVLSSPDKLASLGEKEMKDLYKELRNDSPISGPGPDNSVLVYMFELDKQDRELTNESKTLLRNLTADTLKGQWKTMRSTAEVRDTILKDKDVLKGLKYNMDYVEVNMVCPSDTQEPMLIGKGTRYKIPDQTEWISRDPAMSAKMLEAHQELCLATFEKIEDLYRQSSRVKKYNEQTDTVLLSHFSTVVDLLENPWATKEVISMNYDLISMLYPAVADEIAVTDDAKPEDVEKVRAGARAIQKEVEKDGMTDLSDLTDDEEDAEEPKKSVETEELDID